MADTILYTTFLINLYKHPHFFSLFVYYILAGFAIIDQKCACFTAYTELLTIRTISLNNLLFVYATVCSHYTNSSIFLEKKREIIYFLIFPEILHNPIDLTNLNI